MRRFNLILNECRNTREVLHLGSYKGELNEFLVNNGIKIKTVDYVGSPDFKQDLNDSEWKSIEGKYDLIIAPEIIEHIRDPISFISNCYNLLNYGGRLLITTPNATSLIYLYNPYWCVSEGEYKYIHIHAFTMGMLNNLLKQSGFEVIKNEWLNEFVFNPIGKLICAVIPKLRGDLFVVGVKA